MERWIVKIFALVGTFILPLVCTLLPYRVSKYITARGDSGKRILSYLMCLGGGIFFGTYLLHMGPEVRNLLNDSLLVPYHIDYPVAELITGIGFFFVLFAEKIVLRCNKRRLKRKKANLCRNESETIRETISPQSVVMVCSDPEEACQPCVLGLPCSGKFKHGVVEHSVDDHGVVKLVSCTDIEDIMKHSDKPCDLRQCPFIGSGDCCSDDKSKKTDLKLREKQILLNSKVAEAENEAHGGGDGIRRPSQLSIVPQKLVSGHKESISGSIHSHHHSGGHHHHNTRSMVLILALSLHRIFEGMSVGLQMTTQDVVHLFVAVMCHETVIGFSLGLQFVKSNFPLKRMVITTLLCSIIMPIGVAIGTIMTETGVQSRELDISNGILQAFAMGTFIYVTFFEILQEEIDPEDTSVAKIFFIALGFFLMALLTLIPEEQKSLMDQGALLMTQTTQSFVSNLTTLSSL